MTEQTIWDDGPGVMRRGDRSFTPTQGQTILVRFLASAPGQLFKAREIEAALGYPGIYALSDYRGELRKRMRGELGDDSALVTVWRKGMRWEGGVVANTKVHSIPWDNGATILVERTDTGGVVVIERDRSGRRTVKETFPTWPEDGAMLTIQSATRVERTCRVLVAGGPET